MASFTASIETSQIQGKPAIARYLHGRAQAYENLGQTQKAQQDYRESCRLAKRGCEKLAASTR